MPYFRFLVFFLSALSFLYFSHVAHEKGRGALKFEQRDRVMLEAPWLVIFSFGDQFLAANFEAVRLSVSGVDAAGANTEYLARAHHEVARLQPCHEDNYYLASGLLAWGGGDQVASEVLLAAIRCRSWDGVPPFLYAVNNALLGEDVSKSVWALRLAAERWPENAVGLKKLEVMLRAEKLANANLAIDFLREEQERSGDPRLVDALEKRIARLEGLLLLRRIKVEYEASHVELRDLEELVLKGYLPMLPRDPLGIGYELRNGEVQLKRPILFTDGGLR